MKKYYLKLKNFTTDELVKLLVSIPCDDEEKFIEFEKGEYRIDADELMQLNLYITNTTADDEYSKNEIPHHNRAPIYLNHIKNLTVNGNGARLVINGKSSNMVIKQCENITIRDLNITADNPEMHELQVVNKGVFFVDYKIDSQSKIDVRKSRVYFTGYDYERPIADKAKTAWWIVHFPADKPGYCHRVRHPLYNALKISRIGENLIRVFTPTACKINVGDKYYLYDVRRQYVGIFVEDSQNITLENIKQSFNYSLAFVAQNTENITLNNVDFTPDEGRELCSVADFIQICMCRGKVTVKNSRFSGAGDDCMNVHGFNFKIVKQKENVITVRFMHPQSHGFNPFMQGDEIAFVNGDTLLDTGYSRVEYSKLIDEYNIELTLTGTDGAVVGEFVENISACPHVEFTDNIIDKIVTRGLLITTRGRVNIENNHFGCTGMSGILLSDDASSWYESGPCHNVTIRNNTFDYCGENGVLIKPENKVDRGPVHKNIKIENNVFKKCERPVISSRCVENLVDINNKAAN